MTRRSTSITDFVPLLLCVLKVSGNKSGASPDFRFRVNSKFPQIAKLQQKFDDFFVNSTVVSTKASIPNASIQVSMKDTLTREMFNAITALSSFGEKTFDDEQFEQISSCMAESSSILPQSSDASWEKGFLGYYVLQTRPEATDPWGGSGKSQWDELNPTPLYFNESLQNITVYEPCNFLSSWAFYRNIPEICAAKDEYKIQKNEQTAIVETLAMMGVSAAMFHASNTHLGGRYDTLGISLFSFIALQIMNTNLASLAPENGSEILLGLSTDPRTKTAFEVSNDMARLVLDYETGDWVTQLSGMDMPNYFESFTGIGITCCMIALKFKFIVIPLATLLTDLLDVPDDAVDLIFEKYIPALENSLNQVSITFPERVMVFRAFWGIMIKFLFAFLWQEQTFDAPFIYNPIFKAIGAVLMPYINSFANLFTGLKHFTPSIQNAKNVYPGDKKCRTIGTHSKWHEEAANGLVDVTYIAFRISGITLAGDKKVSSVSEYISAICFCLSLGLLLVSPLFLLIVLLVFIAKSYKFNKMGNVAKYKSNEVSGDNHAYDYRIVKLV